MNYHLRWFLIFMIVGSGLLWHGTGYTQDLQRGLRNYLEVLSGGKKVEQLSLEEQKEVLIIFKRVKARSYSEKSSECRDAMERAESAAADLADYARRLRDCAEANDFTDDCSSEFYRLKSAHSDYEDAVSAVNGYCR